MPGVRPVELSLPLQHVEAEEVVVHVLPAPVVQPVHERREEQDDEPVRRDVRQSRERQSRECVMSRECHVTWVPQKKRTDPFRIGPTQQNN